MPKGPQGQKRKADVIGNAVLIGRIATGESQETVGKPKKANGAKARAIKLTDQQRAEIAREAANARWKKS
ncbi:MAG TPA: hypothetical protein VG387_15565 [Rhizomicrobium sp.]|jgi:fructoselysine-6-P-deglycase FrlB-like protein|nr:hypothetical protein [Rhizomicrobium sp.]